MPNLEVYSYTFWRWLWIVKQRLQSKLEKKTFRPKSFGLLRFESGKKATAYTTVHISRVHGWLAQQNTRTLRKTLNIKQATGKCLGSLYVRSPHSGPSVNAILREKVSYDSPALCLQLKLGGGKFYYGRGILALHLGMLKIKGSQHLWCSLWVDITLNAAFGCTQYFGHRFFSTWTSKRHRNESAFSPSWVTGKLDFLKVPVNCWSNRSYGDFRPCSTFCKFGSVRRETRFLDYGSLENSIFLKLPGTAEITCFMTLMSVSTFCTF